MTSSQPVLAATKRPPFALKTFETFSLKVMLSAVSICFEKWLDQKEDLPGFWSRMFHRPPATNSFHVFASPADAYEADLARQDADDMTLRDERAQIDDSEAAWVVAHLTRGGQLSSAEKLLLQFLDAQALSIAPPLRGLIGQANRAGVSSPRP
jgi:hypothetical protein